MKNALERGEPLAQAMQSFLNAGYNSGEIELASKKINEIETDNKEPKKLIKVGEISSVNKSKNSPIKPKVIGSGGHKGLIIGLLASLGLIIIALILLYIFQDQIFAI